MIFTSEEELSSVFDTETISDEDDIPLSDFCQISSDESGGENSHTGDQYLSRDVSPLDAFSCIFSNDLIDVILRSTNRKAVLMQAEHTGLTLVQKKLRHFFGLLLLAGVCRRKREATAELWNTDRPEFQRPVFLVTMSRNRFNEILRYIRFHDNRTRQ
ncbi:PiggyBac transposable element-derived protein [Trichinella pseudospiralis]